MNMSRGFLGLGLVAGVAGLAGQSAAQCDVFWPGIPDFDQRRIWQYDPYPFVTHVGLSDNGAMHCVPTSMSNILAVLDDAGYNVIVGASNVDWQSQLPVYNTVGTHIGNLGDYMDTDSSGTNFGDGLEGLMDWIADRGHGDRFFVMGFKADDEDFPKVKRLYALAKMGWPTIFGYGRYYRDGDQLERNGGHAVTLVGTLDGCSTCPTVRYHDPNTPVDSDSGITQSEFTRVDRTLYRRFLNMDGDMAWVYTFDESFNGTASDPIRVYDSWRSIVPLSMIGLRPTQLSLGIHQLGGVFVGAQPSSEDIPSPTGGVFVDAAFHHVDLSYLTVAAGGRAGQPGIFKFDLTDRRLVRVQTFARTPDRILVDRYGHYYVQLGALVEKYKLVDDAPVPLGSLTLPNSISAWALDDATDTIVCLAGGNTRLIRFGVGLNPIGNTPVPTGVTLPGDGSVAIDPLGRMWAASSDSTAIFRMDFDPVNGRASVGDTASNGAFRNIRGFSFTPTGRMIVCGGDRAVPFELDRNGRWVEDTDSPWVRDFRSIPLTKMTDFSRPRHNQNARNNTPGWNDVDPIDEPILPGARVCAADFNLDGFLDFFDYADYVACYEGDGCPRGRTADYNLDNFTDFFDYTEFVAAFERGC